jgi:hypothetical protein
VSSAAAHTAFASTAIAILEARHRARAGCNEDLTS